MTLNNFLFQKLLKVEGELEDKIEHVMFELLDSKGHSQRQGCVTGFQLLAQKVPPLRPIEELTKRLHGTKGNAIGEAASILIACGEKELVKDSMMKMLDPSCDSLKANPAQLREIIGVISSLTLLGKDKEETDRVVNSLVSLLGQSDDNWFRMELIQAIEDLGFYDNRLINALDYCLRNDSKGVNTLGVRSASVHALISFGVPPNGRQCWQVMWIDKLKRGKSKWLRANILLAVSSLILAGFLFFTMLYPEIAAVQRSLPTEAHIIESEWSVLWGFCRGLSLAIFSTAESLCLGGNIKLEYTPNDQTESMIGYASTICRTQFADESVCDCCLAFRANTTIEAFYDPKYKEVLFIDLNHNTASWHSGFFHTIFWPCFFLMPGVLSIWPLFFYSWKQSRLEKGHPLLCCGYGAPQGHQLL